FKSARPRISRPLFASQVDVNNDFSKPVTTHYLPREREYAFAKPHHVIAPRSSRYSSNDLVHNHYLEEAKKKTQESGRNSEPSVMPSARSESTTRMGFKEFSSDVQAMTSDHNCSELGIHDHNNEQSSSKLVPKVVSPADKITTSRQELELLFHHHITMPRTTFHKLLTRVLRIILVIVPEHPGDTYVLTMKMEILLEPASNKLLVEIYALSWKPCQGDSLNLPDTQRNSIYTVKTFHTETEDGDGDALFRLKGLGSVTIRRIQGVGYGVLEFLGVGTTFDIFQNIHLLYLQYGVLIFSRNGVLVLCPSWSLVSAGMDMSYLS
ncbi:hypothetical protein Tco_0684206, partial [Tanacetum coccineum]